MWKQRLGISLNREYPVPMEKAVKMIANAGFDAISPICDKDEVLLPALAAAGDCGLLLQSLHAPFGKATALWFPNEYTAHYEESLRRCLDLCAKHEIPTLVMHAWIGFDYDFRAEKLDFSRFEVIVRQAEELGVKIAFENTEGEEYLDALMAHFAGCDTVGFCWDSGHEQCYNHSRDLLSAYGDRLIMTHLNDNLGISALDGKTTSTDDLHLLPYDGIIDWDAAIHRLKTSRKLDCLNFELSRTSKPGRWDNTKYEELPLPVYFAEAYARACRIASRYTK